MLPALVFLPIADIPEAFQDLIEVFPTDVSLVADYFEDVYIGKPRRNCLHVVGHLPSSGVVSQRINTRINAKDEQQHRSVAPGTAEQRGLKFSQLLGVPGLHKEGAVLDRDEAGSSRGLHDIFEGIKEARRLQPASSDHCEPLRWSQSS
ncbi:uncharacterized protein LOC115315543 [Ixodes scapularis]|uniref:uncharacterized protein LOC115315543 n=1 Tax=Ixodes scapularis TaxID=6945 RepID=UPI001A9FD79E|nr:uncharacterized protein LOC115315543 [Ixodes scapularis]